MENIITDLLTQNGFDVDNDGIGAVATKGYTTAVGNKEAHVYLSPSDGYNRSLTCLYFSKGENRSSKLIPIGSSDEKVEKLTGSFIVDSEEMIANSFANKLTNND